MTVSKHYVSNLRQVIVAAETTPGTAVTPADADFNARIYGGDLTIDVPVDDENSKFGTGDHGEDESIPGTQSATLKVSTKIAWGGAAATAPGWWKLLTGCGMVDKTYTTTGLAKHPKTAGDDTTLTIWVVDIIRGATPTAIAHKLAGCMGDGSIYCDGIGKPWMFEGTFKGKLSAVEVITSGANQFVLTSADTALPEVLLSNAVTIGSKAKKISSFRLSFGNDVQPQVNQSEATGFEFFGIVNRRPRFSINPLMVSLSGDTDSDTPFASLKAGTVAAGTIVGAHHTLTLPRMELLSVAQASREGLVSHDLNYKLLRNGSADAVLDAETCWEFLQGARA
jgi:hypothetical protein